MSAYLDHLKDRLTKAHINTGCDDSLSKGISDGKLCSSAVPSLEMMHITYTHTPLAKASHMAVSTLKGARKLNFMLCPEVGKPERPLSSTADVFSITCTHILETIL